MRISKKSAKVDWAAIDAMTDEDINRQIATNPDTVDTSDIPAQEWRVVKPIDVFSIRQKCGLTQKEFSYRFAIPVGTLRHWEQGKREPRGAARVLLTIIEREPEMVLKALTRH